MLMKGVAVGPAVEVGCTVIEGARVVGNGMTTLCVGVSDGAGGWLVEVVALGAELQPASTKHNKIAARPYFILLKITLQRRKPDLCDFLIPGCVGMVAIAVKRGGIGENIGIEKVDRDCAILRGFAAND